MISRITPSEPFPEDLGTLPNAEVEVLNRKLHRELDHEYVHEDGPSPETESRLEEVTEELDFRDLVSAGANQATIDGAPIDQTVPEHEDRVATGAPAPDVSV